MNPPPPASPPSPPLPSSPPPPSLPPPPTRSPTYSPPPWLYSPPPAHSRVVPGPSYSPPPWLYSPPPAHSRVVPGPTASPGPPPAFQFRRISPLPPAWNAYAPPPSPSASAASSLDWLFGLGEDPLAYLHPLTPADMHARQGGPWGQAAQGGGVTAEAAGGRTAGPVWGPDGRAAAVAPGARAAGGKAPVAPMVFLAPPPAHAPLPAHAPPPNDDWSTDGWTLASERTAPRGSASLRKSRPLVVAAATGTGGMLALVLVGAALRRAGARLNHLLHRREDAVISLL
ncbi:hypothetical protein T492DRAFT_1108720 [Pavlovales sp. CCMP2436]|nr:hypothetical protein T492DRAFT_1108720 [Pavlovales sp. CCMP2436]